MCVATARARARVASRLALAHALTRSLATTQVREYLTKIYQLPVVKVNTANHMGRRKRIMGRRRMYSYKRPDFKRAFVTFERTQVYFPSAEAAGDN